MSCVALSRGRQLQYVVNSGCITGWHGPYHVLSQRGNKTPPPPPPPSGSYSNKRQKVRERLRGSVRSRYSQGPLTLLGIESSFDDTGVAVVDESGCVLGEGLCSQIAVHKK